LKGGMSRKNEGRERLFLNLKIAYKLQKIRSNVQTNVANATTAISNIFMSFILFFAQSIAEK